MTQTTLSVDDTREIMKALKQRFPALATPKTDDICYATQNRQNAVKELVERQRCDSGGRLEVELERESDG